MKIAPKFEKIRKFEIPYNFDPEYLNALKSCGLNNENIAYIYVAPFHEDYIGVTRFDMYGAHKLDRNGYVEHIKKIAEMFPGKMQLLLQKKDQIMDTETIKWYINLGFTNFCCGNIKQAKVIKDIDKNLSTISSIVMHISKKELWTKEYKEYFDMYVLDFSYCKDIQKIKQLPSELKYMLLINALCNTHCKGDHHWFVKSEYDKIECPGKLSETNDFSTSCLVRPMDLVFFDPYIEVYKLGDRSWETEEIIRDIVLYTTDYSYYPGIDYDASLYEADTSRG